MEKDNFQAVVEMVKYKGFPSEERESNFKSQRVGESHSFRRNSKEQSHDLITYEFEEQILGINVIWSYNRCGTCRITRNQSVTVIKPNSSEVFRHYFFRNADE